MKQKLAMFQRKKYSEKSQERLFIEQFKLYSRYRFSGTVLFTLSVPREQYLYIVQ